MAIYEARVIDNSTFASDGYIKVRIKENVYNIKSLNDEVVDEMGDLSENDYIEERLGENWIYKEKKDGEDVVRYIDSNAYVYSPFGGGYDYGLFYLPQPNSYGIVSTIGNDNYKNGGNANYIWMGTLYTTDSSRKKFNSNIPTPYNGNDVPIEDKKFKDDYSNMTEAIVLKTRSTLMDASNPNADRLNWNLRPVENMIVISRDEINITHNMLGDNEKDDDGNEIEGTGSVVGNSNLLINSSGIKLDYDLQKKVDDNDEKDERYTYFKIDNYGNVKFKQDYPQDDATSLSIETTDDDLTMEVLNNNNYSDFHMTTTQVEMSGPNSKILLDTSSTDEPVITIDAGKGTVNVNAQTLALGATGGDKQYGVVLGLPGTTMTDSNGNSFTASDRIYG